MITKISSYREGQIVYHFDNGVDLSFVWNWGSYSDNATKRPKDYTNPQIEYWESTTVECYSIGGNPNGIVEYLEKKYNGNPAGYIPVDDIPKILKRAEKVVS